MSSRRSRAILPLLFVLTLLGVTRVAQAQTPTVTIEALECLPVSGFTPVFARVGSEPAGAQVRLYFRRAHEEVEDFYYVVMEPTGDGRYYAVLPKPADEEFERREIENPQTEEQQSNLEAAWWLEKEESADRDPNDDLDRKTIEERASVGRQQRRDWLTATNIVELDRWLKRAENEPAEIFVAVVSANGQMLAKTAMQGIYVRKDCRAQLTPKEEGFAYNLVIGETAPWQGSEPVFHWLCDGIVTRIDHLGIKREDEFCRACVVAWWRTPALLPLLGSTSIIIANPRPRTPPIDGEPVTFSQP
jgi:hypothetical protein